jgi:hypothetical protein
MFLAVVCNADAIGEEKSGTRRGEWLAVSVRSVREAVLAAGNMRVCGRERGRERGFVELEK